MIVQCPGCGSVRGCACTPASIRAQLEKDRIELDERAIEYTAWSLKQSALRFKLEGAIKKCLERTGAETSAPWNPGCDLPKGAHDALRELRKVLT